MYFSKKKFAFYIYISFFFGSLSLLITLNHKTEYIFKALISIPLYEGNPVINPKTYSNVFKDEILNYIYLNPECNYKKAHDLSFLSKRLRFVIPKDTTNQFFIYFLGDNLVILDKCFNSLLIFIENDLLVKTNPFFLKIIENNNYSLDEKKYILEKISSFNKSPLLEYFDYYKLLLYELDLVEAKIFNYELVKFKDNLASPKIINSINVSNNKFSLNDIVGLFFLSCLSGFIVGFIFINNNRYRGAS